MHLRFRILLGAAGRSLMKAHQTAASHVTAQRVQLTSCLQHRQLHGDQGWEASSAALQEQVVQAAWRWGPSQKIRQKMRTF